MNENDASLLLNHFESLGIQPSKKTEGKTAWKYICLLLSRIKGKSAIDQAESRSNLIGYCRLWEIVTGPQLLDRWVYHPDEKVKLQLEKEFMRLKYIYKLDLEKVLECVATLWRQTENLETSKGREPIRTLDEAEELFGVFKSASFQKMLAEYNFYLSDPSHCKC